MAMEQIQMKGVFDLPDSNRQDAKVAKKEKGRGFMGGCFDSSERCV